MEIRIWAGLTLLALYGKNLRGEAITFSVDIASPTLSMGFTANDILVSGPNLFRSGSSLGLSASDSFGDFSFGNDPISQPLYFGVGREAVGTSGSEVYIESAAGGANGSVYQSLPPAGSNSTYASDGSLGLGGGLLGDDVHGLSLMPYTGSVYFTLEEGSPSLSGLSAADIFLNSTANIFATYAAMGLQPGDEIDGLVLLDRGRPGLLDPGVDEALFSVSSFSQSSSLFGGSLQPGAVYLTNFNGSSSLYASATSLGLRSDDELHGLATVGTPEPGSLAMMIIGCFLVAGRLLWGRRRAAGVLWLLVLAVPVVRGAETCTVLAGTSPPVAKSTGTLILPDLNAKTFRWVSNDTTFGKIDTGVVKADKWDVTGQSPMRVIFTGTKGGVTYSGNVLLSPAYRADMDLVGAGGKRIRYLVILPQVEVTNIKFDHSTSNTTDGVNIRKNFADDLGHLGNGVGNGEWIKGSRNEPALWVADQKVTIKVRFKSVNSFLTKADISAKAQGGLLPDVNSTTVSFTGTSSNPAYVQFSLSRATDAKINKVAETWQWSLGSVNGCGGDAAAMDNSGPHTIYTVLDVPKYPWLAKAANGTPISTTEPWVTALDFVADTVKTTGKTKITDAADTITSYLFGSYGLQYDIDTGAPAYLTGPTSPTYSLTNFLAKTKTVVNCYDLAASVTTLCSLIGAPAQYRYLAPFGYIKTTKLIGRGDMNGDANNPFYGPTTANVRKPVVDAKACAEQPKVADPPPVGRKAKPRSSFGNHAFVTINDMVYDANVKPVSGDAGYRRLSDRWHRHRVFCERSAVH